MDLDGALTVFGLTREATPVDVGETYRKIRKPLLKELNKYDDAEEPAELVEKLDEVDTAYKILQKEIKPPPRESTQRTGTGTTKRTTGRVSFERGDVLAGRFEIEALIAHRPEGDTYRVHDQVRDVKLGMKVIAPQLLAEPRRRARLLRGLLAASRVNHPHLARVLDVHPMQQTYAVTLQVPTDADNLWELMYGAEGQSPRLTSAVVLGMTEQATKALAQLHQLTPHAALRPESFWVAKDGTVKIADYGFADVQRALRERRLSRTKLGTAYWAPEQYRDDAAVDARSDQYSLGLILYEILSGKPLVGRTQKIRSFRKDYPQRFTDAVERALASKRDRRFDDMNAFGDAAFPGFRAEGMAPTQSRESMLIPILVLFALFIGFAMSPFGREAADVLGSAVGNWRRTDQQVADADRELRGLRAMSAGLAGRMDDLDETSRAELAKIRKSLDEETLDAQARGVVNGQLANIVRKLVAESYRRAEKTMTRALRAAEPLERHGLAQMKTTGDRLDAMQRDFDPDAPLAEREKSMLDIVRLHAARARAERAWRERRAGLRGRPEWATASTALLAAESQLAVGDEEKTGAAYRTAADALEQVATAAEAAAKEVSSFEPQGPAGTPNALEGDDKTKLLDALIEPGSALTEDADIQRMLDGLRDEALAAAEARWLVHGDGYWSFSATVGARSFLAGGTWDGSGSTQRLRVLVFGDGLLEAPYEIPATRGGDRPGLGDVRAALAAGPRDAGAWWSVAGARPLAPAVFTPAERTVREREPTVTGRVEGAGAGCVLADARRFDVEDGTYAAKLEIPGDVLGTWVRAHVARGLRSGPGSWLRLKADALGPRVKVLEPAPGASLPANAEVPIRILVYDSNLRALEIQGKPHAFREDDVYVLVDIKRTTPAGGSLKLNLTAVDEAGNETPVELEWDIE